MYQKQRGRSLGLALCSAVVCCIAFTQHSMGSTVGSDSFTYPNGPLVGAAGSTWATHNGTTGQIQVSGGEITLVQSTNSEDANLPLASALGAGGKYYAAFDLRVPTPSGAVANVYFAHHQVSPSTFRARIWFLTGAPTGFYRIGISDTGTAPATIGTDVWATDIAYGATIRVVSSYNYDTGASELWINPVNEASTKLTVAGTATTPIAAYGFREASSAGTSQQVIDNLCVGTLFNDVVVCGAPPTSGACCNAGNCSAPVTQTNCTNGGGTYLGDGSICQAGTCTPGACCVPDGLGGETCQQAIQYTCVNTLNGFFQGAGVACTNPIPCGPTGACCAPTFVDCFSFLTQSECTILHPGYAWYVGESCTLACGPRGACCELNGTCTLNVTQAQCDATNGRNWTQGAGSCTGCTAATQKSVIISEYYEADGTKKAIELYNPTGSTISLDGHFLALYSNGAVVPSNSAILNGITIPSLGVKVFINNNDILNDIPNFDEGTAVVLPGVINFNGDDAVGIYFLDPNTVVDLFGKPSDGDAGPRGANPTLDAAWERKCFVTSGTADFDSCNFDNQSLCSPAGPACPPNTPVFCVDGVNQDQWIYEGRNVVANNANHTLGVHTCNGPLPTGACCPADGGIRGGCTCPGDLTGDNNVNFADVSLFVAALLNGVYDQCADMQPNGADNGGDVQAFVAAVLAQTQCGITACTVLEQGDCVAFGGTYLGDGTNCAGDPCTTPLGACCTTSGCQDGVSQIDCAIASGIYFGDNSTCAANPCNPNNSTVVINEIRASGDDPNEYFELAGPPGTLLTGLTYVIIGDSSSSAGVVPGDQSGAIDKAIDLSGQIIPADGRFLAGTGTFTLNGASPDFVFAADTGSANFENSDNVTHMLVTGFTGAQFDVLDDNRDGTLNATLPWTNIQDWVSLKETENPPAAANDEWSYDAADLGPNGQVVGPDGTFVPGHVYRNTGASNLDGPGTPWQIGPFSSADGDDTPGVPNVIIGACCVETGGTPTCTDGSRADCEAIVGGIYKGTGNLCASNPCQGACCLNQVCSIKSPVQCAATGGLYLGDASTCAGNPCSAVCSTVAQARQVVPPSTSPIRVCGVVTSIDDLVLSASVASFQIHDFAATGDGRHAITVFGGTALINSILTGVSVGDNIDLSGRVSLFNGLLELDDAPPTQPLLKFSSSPGGTLYTPDVLTTTQLIDGSTVAEAHESELVTLQCVQFLEADGTRQFETAVGNYYVTDGVNAAVVRINTSNLLGLFIPVGPVNVTGIVSQFDSTDPRVNAYQLLPRSINDIVTATCPAPTGACCTNDVCATNVTHRTCLDGGGVYLGDGTNCASGCPTNEATCLIISEVVDGNRLNGTPKWIEITNTGTSPYRFPAGGIIVQSDAAIDRIVDVVLTGTIINPGQSWVVCATGSDAQQIFENTYDGTFPGGPIVADRYVSQINGNGNDRYILTDTADGSNLIDIYGTIDTSNVNSTTPSWNYADSVAVRNSSVSSGNLGVFNVAEWTITSVATGADEAAWRQNLRDLTTPQSHTYAECTAQACIDPPGVRRIVECGANPLPACGTSFCSWIVNPGSPSIPANCPECQSLNIICVPCDGGSCPNGATQVFKWENYDGLGGNCYFEATVFIAGGCTNQASCPGSKTFNNAP